MIRQRGLSRPRCRFNPKVICSNMENILDIIAIMIIIGLSLSIAITAISILVSEHEDC